MSWSRTSLTMIETRPLEVELIWAGEKTFYVRGSDTKAMIALMLSRHRQKSGVTFREAAGRLGSKSPNSFGVYEFGKSTPTIPVLDQLVRAIDPDSDLVISIRKRTKKLA